MRTHHHWDETRWDESREGWEQLGRAAEHFARRVARDAQKFAARIEEHAGELADDLARDWRRARREYRHGSRQYGGPDVRQIFDDIRGVLADVIEGVDELVARIFPAASPEPTDESWVRVVHNREATCSNCQRTIAAGDEGYLRRLAAGMECRCLDCGVPAGDDDSASAEGPTSTAGAE